jgi:polyisoprenoid-binding protein YceI
MIPQSTSFLVLKGTSTLHDFECKSTAIEGEFAMTPGLERFVIANVSIPVKTIRSESSSMDDNMYEALKEEDYPSIHFSLLMPDSLQRAGSAGADSIEIYNGKLSVAGKEKTVRLRTVLTRKEGGIINIHGSTKLLMTDFGIDPPSFMLGVLKTGNEVEIEFNIDLKDKSAVVENNNVK